MCVSFCDDVFFHFDYCTVYGVWLPVVMLVKFETRVQETAVVGIAKEQPGGSSTHETVPNLGVLEMRWREAADAFLKREKCQ